MQPDCIVGLFGFLSFPFFFCRQKIRKRESEREKKGPFIESESHQVQGAGTLRKKIAGIMRLTIKSQELAG